MLLLVLSMGLDLMAARVTVDMRLDSASMFIGHQNRLYLELSAPMDAVVEMPVCMQDTLIQGLYILERKGPDSCDIDNGRKRLSLSYLLTAFDAGVYFLPPVQVEVDGQTYESNYLTLKVNTYDVDTESKEIFDIKPIVKMPVWEIILDYSQNAGYVVLALALLVLAWWLWKTHYHPKEKPAEPDPELLLPPHIAAKNALDKIKDEHLWQQGRYKEFYTRLTDVLRVYMARRFDFPAREMTTWEILQALKNIDAADEVYLSLKEMLELADFVKFAKLNPLSDENERSLRTAYDFVEQTRETDADNTNGKTEQP